MLRIAACLLIAASAAEMCAQSTSASLSGRVFDPAGGLIAGAKVASISSGTNARYETTTSGSGEYHIANLPPESYRVEIEKSGFKKLVKREVTLHVQDAVKIDFEMTLGEASETITVEAGTSEAITESAAVSTVIDRTFVEKLPLNGRSFQSLILLTPGAVVTATRFDDQGQFSVDGQRADANYFTVDGVSANFGVTGYNPMVQTASGALPALSAAGGTNSLVSAEAMQEFRIQTSSFAPEFGRTPGAQISIATRSGTNAFHGSLFEYFRNSALDAKDWFVNYNGLPKPAERLNDFGGVLGGPVRKDRTFFFASYEGLRLRQPSTQITSVPSPAVRQQASAAIRPYLDAYPVANGADLGNGLAQFSASYSNPSSLDAGSLRLDHAISSKITIFGRYNQSPSELVQRGPSNSAGNILSMRQFVFSSVHTATVGMLASLSPGMSNELRANYSNQRFGSAFALDGFGGAVPLTDAQMFPAGGSSASNSFTLAIPGAASYNQGKSGVNEQRQVNMIDNFSVAAGRHQWKFGVDYRWLAPFTSPPAYRQLVQFSGTSAAPGGALSGTAQIAAANIAQANALLAQNFSLYGQDSWKVTPRLTVTYGLRWDVNPPLKGKNDDNDPFVLTGLNNPATATLAPRGTPLYDTRYRNLAPRVGLAYQLRSGNNWGTTVRGGIGIFYDLGQGSLGGMTSYFPYSVTKSISNAPFPLQPQDAAPPAATRVPSAATILVSDPHLQAPRSYQWNVAVEQSMGMGQSLSATYLGAIGRDLIRVTQFFNFNASFTAVSLHDNSATSDYHALQIKFQRRLASGLQTLASYGFSHSIDSASTDAFSTYLNSPLLLGPANVDRGDSDFDIRHSFTMGATYDLRSPWSQKAARTILGNWSLNAFASVRTAPPVNVVGTIFRGNGISVFPRPNVNSGVPLEFTGSGYAGGKVFNRAAFVAAPSGQQGNLGRNALRGFAASQIDLGVHRQFRVTEYARLRFQAEFFNTLNHPNFGGPMNSLTSPLFGRSTQTLANSLGAGGATGGFSPLYQIGGPRSVQLALKLIF